MINAKKLVREMKTAYKGGGLKIWRQEWAVQDYLGINSGYWLLLIPMSAAPGPVLGLITEWLRALPVIGQGWLLVKDREAERLTADTWPDLEKAYPLRDAYWRSQMDMRPTNLQVDGYAAFQRRDGRIELFAADQLQIIGTELNMGLCEEDGRFAMWKDSETGVRFLIAPRHVMQTEELEHLAQFDFWR